MTMLPCRKRTTTCIAAFVLSATGAVACSEGTGPDGPAAEVELTSPTDTLRSLGETARLTVRVLDAGGGTLGRAPAWTSTRTEVLTVAQDGTVTAVANGEADIVARADAAADTVHLVVRQVATAIMLEGPDTVFDPGVRARFRLTVTDALGSAFTLEPATWSTDDPAVATVEPGLVLPIGAGTVNVTAAAGGLSATRALSVVPLIALEVPAALAEAFQWAVVDSARANGVVGSSAAVYVPGVGTWRGVVGVSGGTELMRPNMLFYPGSIEKMIVSALALSLVDDGLLSLDATIGGTLAPFDNPNIPVGVTLRELIGNTSGVYPFTSHPALGDSVFADLERVWTPRELMERFVLDPVFEPGAGWQSSNSAFVLTGMMAEAATGMPIATLLRQRVFDPMGMDDASTAYYESPTDPVAATWYRDANGTLLSAAQNTTTSVHTALWPQPLVGAESLLLFARALFGDFLGPALRAEMLTSIPDDGGIPGQVGSGLGIRRYDFLGRTQWGHSGSQLTGSGLVVWDEASGIVVSVLYNQSGGSHASSHFRLVPELLRIALEASGATP